LPRWNVTRARFLGRQGGGLYISAGTATLTNTNVYSNTAVDVSEPTRFLHTTEVLSA
jgi:hypothetical protein